MSTSPKRRGSTRSGSSDNNTQSQSQGGHSSSTSGSADKDKIDKNHGSSASLTLTTTTAGSGTSGDTDTGANSGAKSKLQQSTTTTTKRPSSPPGKIKMVNNIELRSSSASPTSGSAGSNGSTNAAKKKKLMINSNGNGLGVRPSSSGPVLRKSSSSTSSGQNGQNNTSIINDGDKNKTSNGSTSTSTSERSRKRSGARSNSSTSTDGGINNNININGDGSVGGKTRKMSEKEKESNSNGSSGSGSEKKEKNEKNDSSIITTRVRSPRSASPIKMVMSPRSPKVENPKVKAAAKVKAKLQKAKANKNKSKVKASVAGTVVKRRRQMKSELDRLLMDEGTVNMLYDNKRDNSPASASKEDKLAELKLRRIEVFNKVRKQTSVSNNKKLLREKKEPTPQNNNSAVSSTSKQKDHSQGNTSWDLNDSLIIRRHSDNSSREASPNYPIKNFVNNHLVKVKNETGGSFNLSSNDTNSSVPNAVNKKVRKRASLLSSMSKDDRMLICDPDKNIMTINKKKNEEIKTPYEAYIAATKEPLKALQSKYVLVRKCDKVGHITLTGNGSILKDSLSPAALHEINMILQGMQKDPDVKIVLFSSSGQYFCQGLDLSYLIANDSVKRKKAVETMTSALREFLLTLAHYKKPIIGSVHADAIGLGVTILPLFDLVYASDKATFKTPYLRLGQVPEGIASLTSTNLNGGRLINSMYYTQKSFTATEALNSGLVTEVLWPARFHEELNVRVRSIANQSNQAMMSTKALLRNFFRGRVESALNNEIKMLTAQWSSTEFQTKAKAYLEECK